MTTRFPIVEEAAVPELTLVDIPDEEVLLRSRMLRFKELWALRDPPLGLVYDVENLEFDPIKINQECNVSYEMNILTRINQFGRATTLAYAWGDNLDAIASRYPGGVPRLPEETYDETLASPAEIRARDDRYRRRIYLAPNALAASGTEESYVYWALTADGGLRDASAIVVRERPESHPAVIVTCLNEGPDPKPSRTRLLSIRAYLHRREIKPLTDVVSVIEPKVFKTRYTLWLSLTPDADEAYVKTQAQNRLEQLVLDQYFLGTDATHFRIMVACGIAGVHNVDIVSPVGDLKVDARSAVLVEGVDVYVRTKRDF